jgi:cation diffusion facilitator family transporter
MTNPNDCLLHDHSFGQDRVRPGERRTFIVIAVTATMMVVEIAAGFMYGSMALLADGLHMGSHAATLGITAFAYLYARKRAHDRRFSFGTGKTNALGGFASAVLLAGFAAVMAWESIERFVNPVTIRFNQAIMVAVLGLMVNAASVFILGGHGEKAGGGDHDHSHDDKGRSHDDHSLRAAYLHVFADALTSLFAIFALLAGKYFGLNWMDPLMGIAGAVLITKWSIGLLRDTARVLLDRQAPEDTGNRIVEAIESVGGSRVTDLHVWSVWSPRTRPRRRSTKAACPATWASSTPRSRSGGRAKTASDPTEKMNSVFRFR